MVLAYSEDFFFYFSVVSGVRLGSIMVEVYGCVSGVGFLWFTSFVIILFSQ